MQSNETNFFLFNPSDGNILLKKTHNDVRRAVTVKNVTPRVREYAGGGKKIALDLEDNLHKSDSNTRLAVACRIAAGPRSLKIIEIQGDAWCI